MCEQLMVKEVPKGKKVRKGRFLELRTGRIGYRGAKGNNVLDTTAKSGSGIGKVFAPEWSFLMQYKQGELSWQEYEAKYLALLRKRYAQNKEPFEAACRMKSVVLLCYCKNSVSNGQRCHRYILVQVLSKVAKSMGITPIYKGEIIETK